MTDILLLCAIPVEWDALSQLIADPVDSSSSGDPCRSGRMNGTEEPLSIALVEVGVGSTQAALSTLNALQTYDPKLAVFAGIAGGIKDVVLGDVVVASKVYSYEAAKAVAGKLLARPQASTPPHQTLSQARLLAKRLSTSEGFRVLVGPIASGEKLIADRGSKTIRTINSNYNDALAVEMEGSGFAAAMQRWHGPDYLLIRGISDLIDSKATSDGEGWQQSASRNAAAVAAAFIQTYFNDTPKEAAGVRPPSRRVPNVVPNRASQNRIPSDGDIAQNPKLLRPIHLPLPPSSPNECFILITSPDSRHSGALVLGGLPLNLTLDIDNKPDRGGLVTQYRQSGDADRLITLHSPEGAIDPSLSTNTWICIRGLDESREADLPTWKRHLRTSLRKLLAKYAEAMGGRHQTVLVACDEPYHEWGRLLIDDLLAQFGHDITLIATHESEALEHDEVLAYSPEALRDAITSHFRVGQRRSSPVLPTSSGQPHELSKQDMLWLQEDLEIVQKVSSQQDSAQAAQMAFLRGGEISWTGLEADADVLRTMYRTWRRAVEGTLKNRSTLRMNLFHAPGAGGTTVARRTLYDLAETYPSIRVNRFRSKETSRRIEFIAKSSGLSVLCLVDTSQLNDLHANQILEELHASSTPVTLIFVSRRYSGPSDKSNTAYVAGRLDDDEASRFTDAFSACSPAASQELELLRRIPDDRRSAFYFGLCAFDTQFAGIAPYVQHRISDLTAGQERVLVLCSIALCYGQSGIAEYALARVVGLPASRADGLARLLSAPVRGLMWRSVDGYWRPIHNLIAKEILIQLGGGTVSWKDNLTRWGQSFAEFCLVQGEGDIELRSLAEAVLIERGRDVAVGTRPAGVQQFSQLVEDVPSASGAVEMLVQAAAMAPDDPHFAAHVARYYAFKIGDFSKAISYAERARDLDPRDHVLHHILGMVHRSQVLTSIGRREPLESFSETIHLASRAFAESRQVEPVANEHAYISDIQMKLRVVDYAIAPYGSIAKYLEAKPSPIVVESIAEAEDLLATVRALGDERNPSDYERQARAKMSALYGDYTRALELFDSLLSKKGSDRAPIRRQIVWTNLSRAQRNWNALPGNTVERIVRLLEENFHESGFDPRDIRQWWRAIRYLPKQPSQEKVHEVLTYWRERERTTEALYCGYVSYAIDALNGLEFARIEMEHLQRECSAKSIGDPRRTVGMDWVGNGPKPFSIGDLVHQSELGSWGVQDDFWSESVKLGRVEGRVHSIKGPQAGYAKLGGGVLAFFVPSRAGAERGRDESAPISGFLSFTKDGPRLWNPQLDATGDLMR